MPPPPQHPESWQLVGRSDFVALGTYRRSGELVSTAVWIAPDGDDLVVTTERGTGKVKRLRNDGRVLLSPCSRLGKVAADAPRVSAVGVIAGPAQEHVSATAALARKYGLQYRVFLGVERIVRRLQRRDGSRVILRISPSAA